MQNALVTVPGNNAQIVRAAATIIPRLIDGGTIKKAVDVGKVLLDFVTERGQLNEYWIPQFVMSITCNFYNPQILSDAAAIGQSCNTWDEIQKTKNFFQLPVFNNKDFATYEQYLGSKVDEVDCYPQY